MGIPATPLTWWTRVAGPRTFSWGIKVALSVGCLAFLFVGVSFDVWLVLHLLAAVGWAFSYRSSLSLQLLPAPTVSEHLLKFGAYAVARNEIVGAYRVGNKIEVEMLDGDRYTVHHVTTDEAQTFLGALGFDGRRKIVARLAPAEARFGNVLRGLAAMAGAYLVVQLVIGPPHVWSLVTLVALAIHEIATAMAPKREATIGSDGVAVGKQRGGVELLDAMKGVDPVRRDALVTRLHDGGDPTTAAVRARYVEGAAHEPGYRDAPSTIAEAEAVLRSPAATREERIGAAVALRVAGEPEAKIRIYAEEMIDPALREALEEVAAEDEASLRKKRA